MKVLQITVHFAPNIGGVETHLIDLVKALVKRNWEVFVLCYRPLSTKTKWKIYEKNRGTQVFRVPWIPGLFYKFIPNPKLQFMYLFPGLFFVTPFVIIKEKPSVIHAHGLVASTVAVLWGKVFGIDVVISTHSIYSFPRSGLYHNFVKLIFKSAKKVLCLSQQSIEEIKSLGLNNKNIVRFTYWIDLEKFRKIQDAKSKLGWVNKFTVLFVGRLVPEKGINVLLNSINIWNKNIRLVFVGSGPLEKDIIVASIKNPSVKFIGKIDQDNLALFYSSADLTIVPSTSEEGFGRVIIESLASGTPVIGSKKGAISEVIDDTVGRLIEVDPKSIKESVEYFYRNPLKLKKLSQNTRSFAERRYAEENVANIIKAYLS